MDLCVHDMMKWQHRGVRDPEVLVGFGPAVGRCAWHRHRICLSVRISSWKDISSSSRNQPLSERVSCWYFSRCVLVESSSSSSLDFSRWCISAYPAVARNQLLRVISCWFLIRFLGTPFVVIVAQNIEGYSTGRGVGPTGGAPGGG
ncbi:hypothetical protein F511_35119 [Dorcoceras hygrometricum]|uniref:Uncharacterized protein n=1 Tax=Dorcoceras hygrometricum TaxID=472368 RepID=A0A2Z7BNB0_9LAMI|nr:hypothetical protein F511_35119 [Dorcoceras hygrometricum]